MTRFFALTEVKQIDDVAKLLAKPAHWKPGRSAYELASSWLSADGIPVRAADVLATAPEYVNASLVEAFFERQVDLRTPGRPSQTDLLAFVRLQGEYAIVAVEGKVDEPFGPVVEQWNIGPGKEHRLTSLCELLEIEPEAAKPLRYQLFHRAASAVFEAERYAARRAALLVHSFDPDAAGFEDYSAFAQVLGVAGAALDRMTTSKTVGGVELRLGWTSDSPSPA